MRRIVLVLTCSCLLLPAAFAAAQSIERPFDLTAQLAGVASNEFHSDIGVGARLTWHPIGLIAGEAEFTFYPQDLLSVTTPFSKSREEGLFGVTVGPVIGRLRPFGRIDSGFVRYEAAPQPIACLAIFPPQLACTLAAGDTLLAVHYGGGIELYTSRRTIVRADAGDRMVRYPAPVLDHNGVAHPTPYFGHDFRFSIGGGVRF